MKKKIALIGLSFTVPFLAFAQQVTSVQSAGSFVINIINTVAVPVLFAIAFLVFLWGIIQFFILSRGDEEKQAQGRGLMLYGIIGFFLMVSVWGLVNILVGTFSLNSNTPNYPQAPSQ
jgi:hypothetical protein